MELEVIALAAVAVAAVIGCVLCAWRSARTTDAILKKLPASDADVGYAMAQHALAAWERAYQYGQKVVAEPPDLPWKPELTPDPEPEIEDRRFEPQVIGAN